MLTCVWLYGNRTSKTLDNKRFTSKKPVLDMAWGTKTGFVAESAASYFYIIKATHC